MPEFMPEESDEYIYIYRREIQRFSDGKLIKEFFELLRTRKQGLDREYNLSLCIRVVSEELKKRGLMDKSGRVKSKRGKKRR